MYVNRAIIRIDNLDNDLQIIKTIIAKASCISDFRIDSFNAFHKKKICVKCTEDRLHDRITI